MRPLAAEGAVSGREQPPGTSAVAWSHGRHFDSSQVRSQSSHSVNIFEIIHLKAIFDIAHVISFNVTFRLYVFIL